jgi:cytochrome c-type biogenesis protein
MWQTSNIGILTAFGAGLISFLSPCVLPLVPGYVSYVAGRTAASGPGGVGDTLRLPAVGLSGCFVLGFSTVFIVFGASATALGQLLIDYRYGLNIAGGAIVVLFGVFQIGLVRPTWMLRDWRFHCALPPGHPVSAYVLGLAFAFGWTPCIGPILGAILTLGASASKLSDGVVLLAAYASGLGVPFLLAAVFTDALAARLRVIGRAGRLIQMSSGVLMIVMGGAVMTGQLSAFSYWLLDTFPVLAAIG